MGSRGCVFSRINSVLLTLANKFSKRHVLSVFPFLFNSRLSLRNRAAHAASRSWTMTRSCCLAVPSVLAAPLRLVETILIRDRIRREVEGLHERCDTPGAFASPLRPKAKGSLQSVGQ
jgi:hypothetical protein